MVLTVNIKSASVPSFQLNGLSGHMTIQEVKESIHTNKLPNIGIDDMRLYTNTEFRNHYTLAEYHIKENDTVILQIRLPADAPPIEQVAYEPRGEGVYLTVNTTTTVGEVMQEIEENLGIPIGRQLLQAARGLSNIVASSADKPVMAFLTDFDRHIDDDGEEVYGIRVYDIPPVHAPGDIEKARSKLKAASSSKGEDKNANKRGKFSHA